MLKTLSALLVTSILWSSFLFGDDLSFYNGKIDYWPSEASKEKEAPQTIEVIPTVKETSETGKTAFDWKKALDPKNDEFFKEGDYTPPAPFMEVARNPSDDNIKLWHTYIEKKNLLAARLNARLQEYELRNSIPNQVARPEVGQKPKGIVKVDPSRYQFRLYFDSECPHCKRMMQTMKELAESGYQVEAKQVDRKDFSTLGLPFSFTWASDDEIKRHGISSIPFLLVVDTKKKIVYKMSGFKTVSSIFEEIEK